MRVVLGTTKDTLIETTSFMLDLPPVQTRQKVEQFKAYQSDLMNKKQKNKKLKQKNTRNKIGQAYLTHEAAKDKKGL